MKWKIGVLLFDLVDIMDFMGPYEVFSMTTYSEKDVPELLMGTHPNQVNKPFRVYTISHNGEPVTSHHGLKIIPDYSFDTAPKFDILLVPGGPFQAIKNLLANDAIIEWITKQSQQVNLMTSVCSGAFMLAKAGLLSEKNATTNHVALDYLEKTFQDINVIRDQKVVEDGNIITSQGISSGINMAFYVVEKLLGTDVARLTAKTIEYDCEL